MKLFLLFLALILHHSIAFPSVHTNDANSQIKDKDSSKKIIGSSVVTSVSVILNGEKPEFTDAVGHRLPKPQEPLQVASPINLLNPDRYEFYTFDNNGQLVKRIMTLKEIHSIVANGDGEGATVIHHNSSPSHHQHNDRDDPEKNVQDIVTSVQNVLTKEVQWKNNASNPNYQMLDTPDVSSSWSMILPAIFGNTGGDIFPHNRPQQVVMTPDSDVVESVTKSSASASSSSKRKTPKPKVPIKRRTTTTTALPILAADDVVVVVPHTEIIPQKIFMNNEEIIKPLFNRNDVKIDTETPPPPTRTTIVAEKFSTTSKRTRPLKPRPQPPPTTTTTTTRQPTLDETTTKRIKIGTTTLAATSKRPIHTRKPILTTTPAVLTTKRVQNVQKLRPTTTTTTTISRIPTFSPSMGTTIATKKTQIKRKHSTTTPKTDPENSHFEKIQTVKHKKRPSSSSAATTTPSPPITPTVKRSPTKRRPTPTPKPITSTIPIQLTVTESSSTTTKLPTTQMTTSSSSDQPHSVTTSTLKTEPSDLVSLTSIQTDEDINTKLSFDQIIESLKDKNTDITTTENIKILMPFVTAQPVPYSSGDIQKIKDKITTTTDNNNNNNFETTTITTSVAATDPIDGSNVIKFEPLFAELLDPILTQLTTEIPSPTTIISSTDLPSPPTEFISTSQPLIDNEEDYTIIADDGTTLMPVNVPVNTETNSNVSSSEETNASSGSSSSSEIAQRIDDFIANNMQNTEIVAVKQPSAGSTANFDTLNQNSNMMDMKDIQNGAATLASLLEDNIMQTTTTNPNKQTNGDTDDDDDDGEIQALVSDVLNQITANEPPPSSVVVQKTKLPIIPSDSIQIKGDASDDETDTEESSNRFTNLAQISTSIFLPSAAPQEITPQLNSNDKFHMMETLALKLNKTANTNNSQDLMSVFDNIPEIHTQPLIIEHDKTELDETVEEENESDADVISTTSNSINSNIPSDYQPTRRTTTLAPVSNFDYTTAQQIEPQNDKEFEKEENVSTQFSSIELLKDDGKDSTTIREIESLIETTTALPVLENAHNNNNASTTTTTTIITTDDDGIPLLLSTTTQPPPNTDEQTTENIETEQENTTDSRIPSVENEQTTNAMLAENISSSSEKYDDFLSNGMLLTTAAGNDISSDTTEMSSETSPEIKYTDDDDASSFEKSTDKSLENENSSESTVQDYMSSSSSSTDVVVEETTSELSSDETTEINMELVQLITKPKTPPPPPTGISFNLTETEDAYVKLGESPSHKPSEISTTTTKSTASILSDSATIKLTIIPPTTQLPSKRKSTLKPVHYFKQPVSQTDQKLIAFNGNHQQQQQQRPVVRPAALTNLKVTQISTATRSPVKLEPSPNQSLGLEASTMDLQEDIQEFARLCNELAFNYWRSITAEKISNARSLVLCPFALTSMLSMVFLGARGGTSGEMNEILRLDDMVTFNPHLVFKNITESVEQAVDSDIASSAFVREIFSDRSNGKILPFFKDKTQQLYSGHVEEVNFNVVNDIIRRRTNLLVKRHTKGKVAEYLRTNSVWVNGPLSTVSANLFQTDCSRGSMVERDGEMFFQVHPSIRQRRLVPVPAVVWRTGFTAGYDPELDATAVAFGSSDETVSTIYVMPGQHGLAAPGDNLERLERNIMENGISKNSWSHLLTSLMQRPGLEVQLPRFSHRSFVNASVGLQKLGLKALFDSDNADLRGLTGSSNKDVYLSDMIQINTFSTCGEEKIAEHHHVEMYPAPPLRKRNSDIGENDSDFMNLEHGEFGSMVHDSARGFYDDLLDPKYLELPLPLRPRQARIPDAPRLRFDKPFLYFVRHNPTGMILFMGRFNPRLLP